MGVGVCGRRVALLVGSASVIAAFGAVLGTTPPTATTAAECPPGESLEFRTGVCVPAPPKSIVEITPDEFDGVPEVDGVPCTGGNSYECIGLGEESIAAGPTPSPTSSFSGEVTTTSADAKPAH
jgi:hypothetical protein